MKEAVASNERRLSPFIKKLWGIMNDNTLASIVHWTEQGTVVCITDSLLFCKLVLPRYFKHNNWHSFVRQLNLYGFRKVCHFNIAVDYVSGHQETVRQFKHQHFYNTGESDLYLIQRKITSPSSSPSSSAEWYQHIHAFLTEIENHIGEIEKQQEECRIETQYLYQQQQEQQKIIVSLSDIAKSLLHNRALQQQVDPNEQYRNVNDSDGHSCTGMTTK